MGWWRVPGGVIGDGPANVLDELVGACRRVADIPPAALDQIQECYREEFGREPTAAELEALVAFCREDPDGI